MDAAAAEKFLILRNVETATTANDAMVKYANSHSPMIILSTLLFVVCSDNFAICFFIGLSDINSGIQGLSE